MASAIFTHAQRGDWFSERNPAQFVELPEMVRATPHAKPHPAPLLEAARRLRVEPANCWYVGDDLRDIQAGQAAGMATIAEVEKLAFDLPDS